MNINIRRGVKRIYITLLLIIAIPTFFIFAQEGFIFDSYKFVTNINVQIDNKELAFSDFLKQSIDPLSIFDVNCYPYKQTCKIETINKEFKNNQVYTLTENKQTKELIVQMPTRIQYFIWQLTDFIMILCYFLIAYSLYLLVEQILIWIVKGFKND